MNGDNKLPRLLIYASRILIFIGVIDLIPQIFSFLFDPANFHFLWFKFLNAILWLYAGIQLNRGSILGWYLVLAEFICYSLSSAVSLLTFFHISSPLVNQYNYYLFEPLAGIFYPFLHFRAAGFYAFNVVSAVVRIAVAVILVSSDVRQHLRLSTRPFRVSLAWILMFMVLLAGTSYLKSRRTITAVKDAGGVQQLLQKQMADLQKELNKSSDITNH